jgi:hypothetical protein
MSTPSPQFVKNFKKIQSMKKLNHSNQTIGVGNGTKFTRYFLSPAQQSFLHKLKDWLITNPNSVSSDPLQVMEYTSLIVKTLKQDGYDEEDRFIINHIRSLYIKDKDTLPF